MRFIELPDLPPGCGKIRRIEIATTPEGETLAVLVGDDHNTHSVRWVHLGTGTQTCRRDVPVFPEAPDPALSPDLSILAFVQEGEPLQVLVELPFQLQRGQRFASLFQNEYDDDPQRCRCLGISRDGRVLRVGLAEGHLDAFAIGDAPETEILKGEPIALQRLSLNGGCFLPACVIAHGSSHSFGQGSGQAGPRDLFILGCEEGSGYFAAAGCEHEIVDLPSRVSPRAAAFSPDGRLFAIATEGQVRLWEIVGYAPRVRSTLGGHQGTVTALAFSPDGKTLAAASEDGFVHFWDAEDGVLRSSRDWQVGCLGGVVFNSAGSMCIAGGEDGRLVVRDLS